jgi:hypothetical protein
MRMPKMLIAILVTVSVTLVAEAMAQMQTPPPAGQRPPPTGAGSPPRGDDKIVEGQVRSVDPSGMEVVLTDGTRLVVPPGSMLKPGVVKTGVTVIASYREENGSKVLTELVVTEPPASPPTEPRSPEPPSTAPPGGSPKRY